MMNYASVSVLGLVTFAAITLFYHHHAYGWLRSVATRQIALGGLFGLGTILLMLHSKEVSSGLLLDARVLLMGYAGLLAGWRGATIALTLAVSARLLIGGQGLLIGCLTLTVAPLIGLAWRHLVGRITVSSTWHYLGFGVALSLSLVTIALFPAPHAANPLSAVPGLIAVNIIGSLLAGYMELGIQETAIHRGEIQRLAMTDELTGLNNRLSFNQHISQRLTELKTPFQPFALISLDIDNFRNINSTLGHKVGDQLLVSIAGNLQQAVKHEETLARIEGDEFVVLMPCSSITEAFSRAEQLLNVIRMPHKIDHYVIMTTASAGISWATKHDLDSRVLLQDAEIAMYQSKRKGRNHSTAFEEKMRFDVERTSKLTHALQQALVSAEGLRIVFQPQVSLIDGSVASAEVLLRWHHPEFGDVSPGEFIPLAESSGLIRTLDRTVFEMAAKQLAEWIQAGFNIHLSINISVLSLIASGTADEILTIFKKHNVPTRSVVIEVTESEDLANSVEALDNIQQLRAAGVSMELDDFGTGHSSLVYLQRLPLTGLKIDQGFVRNIGSDTGKSEYILRATIALAKAIDLKLIAEGVETTSQLDWLRTNGCDAAQGYLLGKPMDKAQFLQMYQSGGGTKQHGHNNCA